MKRVLPYYRIAIAAVVFALAAPSPAAESAAKAAQRPNIILLLADDLGWTDLHTGATSMGNGTSYHQTPNIDRLAAQGMSFSSMYMCPNCVPARAALMTGQFSPRNGVYNVGSLDRGTGNLQPAVQHEHILHEAVTVAETLKTAGYTTCHVAKFHVSTHEEITKYDGFDFNYGGGKKGDGVPHGYFAVRENDHWTFTSFGPEMDPFALPYTQGYIDANLKPYANDNDPAPLVNTPKHLTDATADAALDFMSKHLASPADGDKPFFINVAFNAVHVAIKPRSDLLEKYKRLQSSDPRHNRPDYAALLEGEDQAIARILRFLDDNKIADHTLVIFFSDNGGFANSTSNAPLRGSKGMFYDGGLRVPLIARLPGVIPPGTTSDVMLHDVDVYPTCADFAGAKLPDPAVHTLDGESFAPILRGQASSLHRSAIYYHFPGYLDTRAFPCSVIIRQTAGGDRYKLFYSYEDQHYEMYDLTTDLSETKNLLAVPAAPAAIEMADQLHDDLRHWLGGIHPLWAKDKKTGENVPMPIAIKDALAAGNKITRSPSPGKAASKD